MICLDETGPEGAKSFPGRRCLRAEPGGGRRLRAGQEADYGRRGSGFVFGAFVPATGEAPAVPYRGRTTANRIDFLDRADAWVDPAAERVYAVLDNPSAHRALDVLLWALAHPRREFVFRPTHAAYPNPIEPWWKILRSPALKGRRFEGWDELAQAVEAATAYRNAHRHPFVRGRRSHRPAPRGAGIAVVPSVP